MRRLRSQCERANIDIDSLYDGMPGMGNFGGTVDIDDEKEQRE